MFGIVVESISQPIVIVICWVVESPSERAIGSCTCNSCTSRYEITSILGVSLTIGNTRAGIYLARAILDDHMVELVVSYS